MKPTFAFQKGLKIYRYLSHPLNFLSVGAGYKDELKKSKLEGIIDLF